MSDTPSNDELLDRCFLPGIARLELSHQPHQRIVEAIDDPFLQRDDGVVGDVDVFGARFGAAAGDVAQAGAALVLDLLDAVVGVEGVHVETGEAHHESWTGEVLLGLAIAQDVTHILTQEALDALAELLNPIDILLHHTVLAVGVAWPRGEGANPFVLLVVPGDIIGQIANHREGLQWLHRDGLTFFKGVHAGHARESRLAVDLHAATSALARLAVPATGEIGSVLLLDLMDAIEDDHPSLHIDGVLDEVAAILWIAAPDPKRSLRHGYPPDLPAKRWRSSPVLRGESGAFPCAPRSGRRPVSRHC